MKSYLAKGIRYERKVAKAYKSACPPRSKVLINQWFEFEDQVGYGNAQVDFVHILRDRALVFEVKLTAFEGVEDELFHLYCPLIENQFGVPAIPVQVFQNSTREMVRKLDDRISSAEELTSARPGRIYHWHLIL